MASKTRVAVLFGGRSGEHEVSLASARSVMGHLDRERYEVLPVGIDRAGKWLLSGEAMAQLGAGTTTNGESPLDLGASLVGSELAPRDHESPLATADVIFPVLHGPYGEDGTIQGLLEVAGLPYVGCGVAGSAVGMDKLLMKALFAAAGLPQLSYLGLTRFEWERDPERQLDRVERELGYPVFVKPANLGSSVGISRATDRESLARALALAARYDRRLVVERGLERPREIEVAVLGNESAEASVAGEIIPNPEYEFYDYESKYGEGNATLIIPAPIDEAQMARCRELALRAFEAVDGAGLSRVDFLLDRESGELYLNELNTMPGFTVTSMYPKLWEASGLPYPALLDRLIELALERHAERARNQQ